MIRTLTLQVVNIVNSETSLEQNRGATHAFSASVAHFPMSQKRRSLVPYFNALAAMLVYGGWAIFANFEHGRSAWLMAGIIQGIYAFGSTLAITVVAHWAYIRIGSGIQGILCSFGLSFLVMLSIPVSIHTVAGTPDILQTILPGLIWGSGYLIAYLVLTDRKKKSRDDN